jgi:ankyrin repeat protein
LVKAGADVNAPLSVLGETPVMMAARTGNAAAVKVLLDNDKIDTCDGLGIPANSTVAASEQNLVKCSA